MRYDHADIELRWQDEWERTNQPADETAAMPSHVSLHDSAHHAVSSFVPQSARHSVRAASIAAIVVTYQMMSQSEPMRWQIAPRMHMTIAAVCVHALALVRRLLYQT